MSDNSLLIIPKEEQKVNFHCKNQDSIEIINHPSIVFPRNCQIEINEVMFQKPKTESIEFRLKLPPIPINMTTSNESPIKVEQIDHSSIKEAIKELHSLKAHDLEFSIKHSHSPWNYILITIIIFTICTVTIGLISLYLLKYDFNCRRQNKLESNLELQKPQNIVNSEKPTVFSET